MATQVDRRAVAAGTSPLSGWFIASGVVLIVSLLAAFFVQARQQALLNQAVQGQDDYLVLNLFQLETEYLRLRERWRQAAADPASAREQLQLRYDIFISRIGLLQTDRAQRVLSESPEYGSARRALRDFVDRCDLYLGQSAQAPFSGASMKALLADLEALDAPVHQMLLAGAHRVAQQMTTRSDTIAQHNRVGIALTVFLSGMVGLFGYLALRRMRQLEDSRRALEAMANHLNDAREQALRASQAKSEFLTNMSHAIRTPFHGMLGMLALLRESRLDARQQDLLRTAVDSADHLLGLLNDIVDLSKLEAGTLTLDVHDVELEPLLREVERVTRAGAAAKDLQLAIEIDPALPRRARLDATRLRQVLTNLTANAIRFTHRGTVTLTCRVVPATAGGEPGLLFVVSDTGVGMSADTALRLFERSHLPERGPARDPMQQGTGLGLEVAYRLMRLMEGDITVDSTLGQGSVFRVTPALRAQSESAVVEPQRMSAPAASARAARAGG
jgi:signal transduction histidine kinase